MKYAYEFLWGVFYVCMIGAALLMMTGCSKNSYESCVAFHEKAGWEARDISARCYGSK